MALDTALTPTKMPSPGDAAVSKANLAAQRAVKKRKGRASTILTGRFGGLAGAPAATALSRNAPKNKPKRLGPKALLPDDLLGVDRDLYGWDGKRWNPKGLRLR